MQTQQLRDKIQQQGEIAHGKGNAFQDLAERIALRNFLANCPNFQQFWKNYFGTPPNTKIKEDPLGEYKVDLGIVDEKENICHGFIRNMSQMKTLKT